MKKIFTLLALMVAIAASADFRTIELDDNLDVREILKTDTMTLDSLKVKGYLNHHNLYFISWMTNRKLEYIDLSECRLENDEMPEYGLNPTPFLFNEDYEYYSKLAHVKLPESLRSIGDWAFTCSKLETIDIPESVEYVGRCVFSSCKRLRGTVKFPEGITNIMDDCLYFCAYVDTVVIPSTVEVIEVGALAGLMSMTEISFPKTLKEIKDFSCRSWLSYYGDMVLPASLEYIGIASFQDTRINSLAFEEGSQITEIPYWAFRNSKIRKLSFPERLESIGDLSFSRNLCTELVFPETLRWIGDESFLQSEYLERIVLPSNIASIGDRAFDNCHVLKDVYIKATVPPTIMTETFEQPADMKLYVPVGAREAYAATEYWKDFGEIVEVEEFPSAGREAVIAASEAVRAFGACGAAVIEGDGCGYSIYAADGRMVAAGTANGRTEVALPRGIYIVDTAGGAHRIAVR